MKQPPLSTTVRETMRRPLRIFPFDPMFDRFHDPIVSSVPYEVVMPGPAGRLVEVVDFDMSANQWLPSLDLNSPEVLITQGLSPSERDLRSHQQMVYAVSMRVLEAFERGLGRPFDWLHPLKLLPHAFDQMAAYSVPIYFAVFFGYFTVEHTDANRGNLARQRIFTSLSYDVVAHEVCHPAILRLRPNGPERDVAAFHEGMADLIAILVRFAEPDVVARIIRTEGADLSGTPLLKMGVQFGAALADNGAVVADKGSLRTFPREAKASDYEEIEEPHERGILLTSAVLEAFLGAYHDRIRDLLRLNGGEPVKGYVHPDLVGRLAGEASSLAARVSKSFIAAMDYLPPVGTTFFDVLRAVLATDTMLFGKANQNYQHLLIQAFHQRGLIPRDPAADSETGGVPGASPAPAAFTGPYCEHWGASGWLCRRPRYTVGSADGRDVGADGAAAAFVARPRAGW